MEIDTGQWPKDPAPQTSGRVKPAAKGSVGSMPSVPSPNIQARPEISGTIAAWGPTCASRAMRAVKTLSTIERVSIESPGATSPRACSAASKAALPVPQGERSMRPGYITLPVRTEAAPPAMEERVFHPFEPREQRVADGELLPRGGADPAAERNQIARFRRSDFEPQRVRVHEGEPATAESDIDIEGSQPFHLQLAVETGREAREEFQRHALAAPFGA